ncbi:MAG: glycoside hydrolase family 75 protein [Janthinobacterium lividum]
MAIEDRFKRKSAAILGLPGGALYIDGHLELDTDGWLPTGKPDPTHQGGTSLEYLDGSPIDSNAVPFIVLPKDDWPRRHGIGLGDFAVVLSGSRMSFAVFADRGPVDGLGEGSLALFRALGEERLRPDGDVINTGMGPGVVTIVFPNSATPEARRDQASLLASTSAIGRRRFIDLGGNAS